MEIKDLFDLIASIINSISWPVASIIIVILLKKPLTNILNRLAQFKYKDFEANFAKEIEVVKNNMDSKLEEIPITDNNKNSFLNEVTQIAKVSPMAAIPFAYSYIENALKEKMEEFNDYNKNNIYLVNNATKYLYHNEKIDGQTFETLNKMRKLRNAISHKNINKYSIDKTDAIDYGKIAKVLIENIKTIN